MKSTSHIVQRLRANTHLPMIMGCAIYGYDVCCYPNYTQGNAGIALWNRPRHIPP